MTDAVAPLLAAESYVRLTTFRRDGTPVATPVWIVADGDGHLLVVSAPEAGKVKRLRHTARVLLTPCDYRGRVAPGAVEVEGNAVLFDDPVRVAQLHRLLAGKYGLLARAIQLGGRLRHRRDSAGIEITLT